MCTPDENLILVYDFEDTLFEEYNSPRITNQPLRDFTRATTTQLW